MKPGTTLNKNDFENLSLKELWKISLQDQLTAENLEKLKLQFDNAYEDIKLRFEDKVSKINKVMIYYQLSWKLLKFLLL